MSPPLEQSTLTLLELEDRLNALRHEMHARFAEVEGEVQRRISQANADATVYSALERRFEQIEKKLDEGFKELLEAVGAGMDRGAG